MTGIVGGLLAALLWGSSTVTDARATRIVGAIGVLGWGSIAGCIVTLPVALAFAHTTDVGSRGVLWLTISSLAAVAAFAPFYRAVRLGPVPLVAGLGATEGAVAATISFATGERLPALTLLGLADRIRRHDVRPDVGAGAGAAEPGAPARGRIAGHAGRIAVRALALRGRARDRAGARALAARGQPHARHHPDRPAADDGGRLPRPGRFLRYVFYSAVAQSGGYFAFLVAAGSSGISVPAVLASQASVVGILISFIVLGERLSRRQLGGIAALLTGVALVAATR